MVEWGPWVIMTIRGIADDLGEDASLMAISAISLVCRLDELD